MRKLSAAAAFGAAFTTAVHVFPGGADVAAPLLASPLSAELRLTLYAVWHLVTAALALSALALAWACRDENAGPARHMVGFIGTLWSAFGLVFIWVALGQPDSDGLWHLPQWLLLLPVGVLALADCRRAPAQP